MKFISLIRKIFRIPTPSVEKALAMEIARAEFSRRGWEMGDPRIIEGLREWTVLSDRNSKSATRIVIDQRDGRVVEVALPLR